VASPLIIRNGWPAAAKEQKRCDLLRLLRDMTQLDVMRQHSSNARSSKQPSHDKRTQPTNCTMRFKHCQKLEDGRYAAGCGYAVANESDAPRLCRRQGILCTQSRPLHL
jgi:hypothetical protein